MPISGSTRLFVQEFDPAFGGGFAWLTVDDRTWSYDLDFPPGGTIVKDRMLIATYGVDDSPGHDSGIVAWDFTLTFDDPTGPVEILEFTPTTGDVVYEGSAPTLFGLIRSGGEINFKTNFSGFPENPPWTRPEPANVDGISGVYNNLAPVATMWIDYTSELDFV